MAVTDAYYRHMIIMVLFYAYLGIAYNIISGYGGQLSLGHSAYLGIGAYTSTIMFTQFGLSPWIGLLGGGITAVITSLVIGYPCFRMNVRGPYFALGTLGFSELIRIYISTTQSVLGLKIQGSMGILIPIEGHSIAKFQFLNKIYYYYIILGLMLIMLYLTNKIAKSKLGYYLIAIKNSQSAAQALGISPLKVKLTANSISAFFTGLGGVFYAQFILFISPERVLGLAISTDVLVLCMVGGFGTIWGPIVGAFLLIPAAEITRVYIGSTYLGAHLIVYGIILIICVYFLPKGLVKPLGELYHRIARKY
jgi:branched-chain amino acid transport system permease protein